MNLKYCHLVKVIIFKLINVKFKFNKIHNYYFYFIFIFIFTGGLEELKTQFKPGDIRFAVLECVVTGDDYNSVKFLLITWVGVDVSAG